MAMLGGSGQFSDDSALGPFRRYVTQFVNRHDFDALPAIMVEDYALTTGEHEIVGRDGAYRTAVAQQLGQFPGLVFTPHDLFHVGNRLAVRFTEHGASNRHGGHTAAWQNIAIYSVRDGRLSGCAIEQDYLARREQLESRRPAEVDHPHVSPWDVPASADSPEAAAMVRAWLTSLRFLEEGAVSIDGDRGGAPRIIERGEIEVLDMLAGDESVAFHAVHRGALAADFHPGADAGQPAFIHMAGLVHMGGGEVSGGHIVRDRWGLRRRAMPRG